jgi:hypothetical protein
LEEVDEIKEGNINGQKYEHHYRSPNQSGSGPKAQKNRQKKNI